jgi:shikimate kinase
MNIIFFGYKKCGKTSLGLSLAKKLSMHFIDTDRLIEELYEKRFHKALSVKGIVKHHGTEFFRELEKQVIFSLEDADNCVIALGGGAVLDKDNVEYLRKIGTLIYLKVDKDILKQRILHGELPTYIDAKDPIASFEQMYQSRYPIYESISCYCIDMSALSEEAIFLKIEYILQQAKESI